MNILFLTILKINKISERGIYTDLIRKFRDEGHNVYVVTPTERRCNEKTELFISEDVNVLRVKTLNIQKTNIFEKGAGIVLLGYQFTYHVQRFFKDIKFDLILYATPPITFTNVVRVIKKRDHAKAYLMLKDIFPQNAVDLGMLKRNGLMHKFFRQKEKLMYKISDYIGCMSPANVKYVISHNPYISPQTVEVCPNCIEPEKKYLQRKDSEILRKKYKISASATIFIYGGNLGKPQGLDFMLQVLKSNNNKQDRFFIIVGTGTEQKKIEKWFSEQNITNSVYLMGVTKTEYDKIVQLCDVGLIFLDKRFTIPNYPSRLLSYLEYKMPVLIATDMYSDLGEIAMQNNYGFFSLHGDIESYNRNLEVLIGNKELIKEMGENGHNYLLNNYTVDHAYKTIMNHF